MLYRVQVDVSFKDEKDMQAFIDSMKTYGSKVESAQAAKSISATDASLTIPMSVKYHQCYHDETNPKPCGNYVTVDIKGK